MTHDAERKRLMRRLRDSVIVPPTSRREFLLLFGAAVGGLAAATSFPRASFAQEANLPQFGDIPAGWKGKGEVVVVTWGGIGTEMQRKAWFEPFEELCGIKVIEAVGPDPAKLKAMVDTNTVQWDVTQIGRGTMLEFLAQGDYLEEIDYSLVEDGVTENYRSPYGLDIVPFAQMMAYRTDAWDTVPETWADFWNTETFPGARSMPIATKGNVPELVGALIAAGASPEGIYPLDIDRAIASLEKIRPAIVRWWEAGAQPMQLLLDNEAPFVTAWNGRVYAAQQEGQPLEILWNGGSLISNAWLLPKNCPNLSNAQKFVAFSSSAVAQARYSKLLPYGFTNVDSAALLDEATLANLPTAPANMEKLVRYDFEWWAANRPEVIDKFNKMMLG